MKCICLLGFCLTREFIVKLCSFCCKNTKGSIDIRNDGGIETRSRWRSEGFLLCCALLVTLAFSSSSSSNPITVQDISINEPHIERIVYERYGTGDYRLQALLAGEIEIDTDADRSILNVVNESNYEAVETLENAYAYIIVNCRVYPLNISGFRRAFAYAYHEAWITNEVVDYRLSKEQDSLVPYVNPFCVVDEFDWHYYEGNSSIGNRILDDLGFTINATTGFREAPNGDPFDVGILYPYDSDSLLIDIASIGVQALESLHVEASSGAYGYIGGSDPWEYPSMFVRWRQFHNYDISWLASEFYSGNADDKDVNPPGFSNSSFDGWCEQLLHSAQYDDVYNASREMQEILHYNVPELVVYQRIYLHAYRTDRFAGFIEDSMRGIENPWTMLQLHLLNGSAGGVVGINYEKIVTTLNFFRANSSILDNVYLSLFARGPNLELIPRLATSVIIESHSDNPAVTVGHTRFTFSMNESQKWSDDTPVTADDVVFTFNYEMESEWFGNPEGQELGDLFSAYAPTPSTAVLEFSGESYWYFEKIAFDYILPEHAFDRSPETWEDWDPFLNPSEPLVNCGPFTVTSFEPGGWLMLQNRYFTPDTPTATATNSIPNGFVLTVWFGVSIIAAAIIIFFSLLSVRAKRRINRDNGQSDKADTVIVTSVLNM
ncbi:MAG: hypothetical protein EAX87_03340 [Candidatus Thorarchaeota archaeon]|nr:hypothetical protein [Candidatus Thorarchaeota archaeon]